MVRLTLLLEYIEFFFFFLQQELFVKTYVMKVQKITHKFNTLLFLYIAYYTYNFLYIDMPLQRMFRLERI